VRCIAPLRCTRTTALSADTFFVWRIRIKLFVLCTGTEAIREWPNSNLICIRPPPFGLTLISTLTDDDYSDDEEEKEEKPKTFKEKMIEKKEAYKHEILVKLGFRKKDVSDQHHHEPPQDPRPRPPRLQPRPPPRPPSPSISSSSSSTCFSAAPPLTATAPTSPSLLPSLPPSKLLSGDALFAAFRDDESDSEDDAEKPKAAAEEDDDSYVMPTPSFKAPTPALNLQPQSPVSPL
jgi:hypothetical protein